MNAPTSFGLAVFLRVAFPGLVAVLLATPLLPISIPVGLSVNGLATVAALSGIAGLILFFLDTFLYQFLEGRILWPVRLRDYMTAKLEVWVDARWQEITKLEHRLSQLENELSSVNEPGRKKTLTFEKSRLERDLGLLYYRVMAFRFAPEDGKPHALWPTRFGNVLARYEYYPEDRYGMDSAFYWYRLWLILPDDTRKEYDNYWAIGQAWLYIAAVSAVSTLVYGALMLWTLAAKGLSLLALSVLAHGQVHRVITFLTVPRTSQRIVSLVGEMPAGWDWRIPAALLGLTALSVLLWASAYWLATEQHRSSGEFFKSLFDLYREELEVQPFKAGAMGDWEDAADYLQYLRGGSVLGRRTRPPKSTP